MGSWRRGDRPERHPALGCRRRRHLSLRRGLRRGTVGGERRPTPQGFPWYVRLGTTSQVEDPPHGATSAGATTDAPYAPVIDRSDAMSASNVALLAPLLAELSAPRATLVAQADTIARHTAELDALKAAQARPASPQVADAEPAPDPFAQPIPSKPNAAPWWRRWWLSLAGAGLVIVGGMSCQGG